MFKRLVVLASILFVSLLLFVRLSDSGKAAPISSQPTPNSSAKTTLGNFVYLPIVMKNSGAIAPLWRFAAGMKNRAISDYDQYGIQNMRLGWYSDWGVNPNAPEPYGTEYLPMVRLKQWKTYADGVTWTTWCLTCSYAIDPVTHAYTYTVFQDWNTIKSAAMSRPGMTWIIGNEIERIDWRNGGRQDEILPELYAQAYHDIRNEILSVDPTAQFAIGGLVEATPLRLQYLDRVWNAYQQDYGQTIPVDVWNIHGFILQEKSCTAYPADCAGADIPAGINATIGMTYTFDPDNKNFLLLADQINALRSWMKSKGQQNKPLFITEYGVNIPDWWGCDTYPVTTGCPFTAEQVRDNMMYPSFNYFLNHTDPNLGFPADGYRLVQRWNWWSLDSDDGSLVNGAWEQYFNGALFYSGLYVAQGGHSIGITPLGTYWQQYVQSLPPGSAKPYAANTNIPKLDSRKQGVPGASPSSNGGTMSSVSCTTHIRLLFYGSSLPGSWLYSDNRANVTQKPTRESVVCLPSIK